MAGARTLGRVAGDVFAYGAAFQGAPEEARPPAGILRQQLHGLLEEFRKDPAAQAVAATELEEARFALVAWLDETVLRTTWAGRDEWQREPLQLQLFRTNRAGDEFYEHLARLRPDQADAREVYLLCLALGFEGHYAGQEAERRALMAREYEQLRAAGRALDLGAEPVAPEAYEVEIALGDPGASRVWPSVLALAGGAAGVLGVLWLALRFLGHGVPVPPGS